MIEMTAEHIKESSINPEPGYAYIYRLVNIKDVIYVGQTKNIRSRSAQHERSNKIFTTIQFYPCKMSDSTEKERDEILKFNPILNKDLPKTDKYITIRQASAIVNLRISEMVSKYLHVFFERPQDKKSNQIYVSASEVEDLSYFVADIIKNTYEKEIK